MFRCKGCQAKDREIEYLHRLIDRLLERLSVAGVETQELVEDYSEPEEDTGAEEIG